MADLAALAELVEQIRVANPEALDPVVSGWNGAGSEAAGLLAAATTADRDTAAAFSNDGAPVYDAPTATRRSRIAFGEGGEHYTHIAGVVGTVRDQLAQSRTGVLTAWDQLRTELAAVDDGRARLARAAPTMTQPQVDAQAAVLTGRADTALGTHGAQIVRLVHGYEDILVSRLRALNEIGFSDPTVPVGFVIPQPPPGATPAEVATWWRSLAPQQQASMIDLHPELIGNLDGIPVVIRDQANRGVLADQIARYKGEQRDLQSQIDAPSRIENEFGAGAVPSHSALVDKLAATTARLEALNKIDERLKAPGATPAYLMGFQPDVGNGRAIVAIGNPDTADNVVTYVPGTTARLDSIHTEIERADATELAARRVGKGQSVAVIAWDGYDAPQWIGSAGETGYADDAQPLLRNFQDGLRATHEGPASRNTVLGHSYGTTVVGHTARDGALDADAVVLVASPGTGVDHVSDLHRPAGTVYSTTAEKDPIQWANLRANSSEGSPVANAAGSTLDVHGRDPSSPEFGADVFRANPGGGHSDYWLDDNPSLRSFGLIATGQEPRR